MAVEELLQVEDRAKEKERRKRWSLLMLLLIQSLEDDLHQVARQWADGKIDAADFKEECFALLPFAHAQAAYLGRRLAGVVGGFDEDDVRFGHHSAEEQEEFLDGFAEDLAGDRYVRDGERNLPAVQRRLALYAMALAGTGNQAWAEGLPDGTLFDWVDEGDSHECRDCRKWARKGPYTREKLPAYPGDGTSECNMNCRCELVARIPGMDEEERSFDLRKLFDGAKLIDG